jgi:pectin methylesterase-like acyl-CoA thioesterase
VTLRVAPDGSGDYTSVQKAIDAAPAGGAVIRIAPGAYREVLEITKNNLQLRGASADTLPRWLSRSIRAPERPAER